MNAVVGGIPITIASSGSSSRVPLNSMARSNASLCAADGLPPNTAAAVSSRGTRSINRARIGAGNAPRPAAQLRPCEPLEDVLFVRIAAEDMWEVQRQRNAEDGHARCEQALDVDRQLPAVRARCLE